MKHLLLLSIAILCTNSALLSHAENNTPEHTELTFSQQGVDELITYLAQGNTVKNIVALNNLTSVEDSNFVLQEVALMRAAGLEIEKSKIEKLVKMENKYEELVATLRALSAVSLVAIENKENEPIMPRTRQEVEDLAEAVICIRQVIALCIPENLNETVEYALDIIRAAQVPCDTKKALIERVRLVNNSERMNTLCDNALATL
jgi:hypothetical protein